MTTLVIDLTMMQSNSPLPTSIATTSIITTTTSLPPPPQPQQSTEDLILVSQAVDEIVTDAVDWAMQPPLQARFRDLPTVDIKEILQQRMFKDNSYKAHEEEARKKKKKKHTAPRTPSGSPPSSPPPPPPLTGASGALGILGASGSSQLPPPHPPPSTSTSGSAQQQGKIENNWASTLVSTYETPAENSLLAKTEDMKNFMKWYCRQMEEYHKMLTDQIDWTNPEGDQVRVDVNQPLPLGGPPDHITIQPQFFFNKDLEYLRYGSKGRNLALSISKMKAASYPDYGLELLKFYIDRHDSLPRRKDVRTHMRILSVVRIKTYSRYGYDYLSKIVLRRANFQEHTIAEKDFKNMYPSDFKDLNLLLLQGHLDHLPGSDKQILSAVVKLWTQNLVIRQRVKTFNSALKATRCS
ncbi:hypothetical protein Tco_0460986 [Tanacetum coccineum]